MKITFCFLLISLNAVFAENSYAQKTTISVEMNNKQIENILETVESQTDFTFLYDASLVNVKKRASIKVNNRTVFDFLNQLFADTDIAYSVVGKKIILNQRSVVEASVQQNHKKISGTVKDSHGETVIGANVVEKGTTNGTITDLDGKFTLNVNQNATIVVSYIGYSEQEIATSGKAFFNILLKEDSELLDEIVVVGYGSVKKSNLTSSVSKISEESVSERPIATVSEALQGQLAGVRSQASSGIPGTNYTIQIRGVNTINGNSSPLYVIDGVPRDNMNDLNPNDISTIQVLKDASATSIYGSRGANGVILVETKQGTGKPTLTFDAYYGLQTAEKKLDMMNADEWVAYNMYQRNLDHLRAGGSMSDPMSSRASQNRIPDEWSSNQVNTDWQDAIMQMAPIQSYNASASAKSDMGSIYFSAGYMNQEGIVKETYYNKMNIRLNAMLNVSDKLRVGVNLSSSSSDNDTKNSEKKEGMIHKSLMISPLVALDQNTQEWGFIEDAGNSSNYVNPLEDLKYTKADTKYLRLNTSIWGEYDILKGLKFKTQYSYNYDGETYEYFKPANVTHNNITSGNSSASTIGDWTIQNTLTYDTKFNADHHLNALLGQSAESQSLYNISATATGWPFENIETLNVATTPTTASTDRNLYRNTSLFGRVNYEYQDKYLITTSVRYDGSSRFGENSKWGLFPSVSAGWKMNKESFLENIDWLSLLKVRASWGMAGNDRIGDYAYMSLLSIDKTSWGNSVVSGVAPENISNPDLQWEATQSLDFGFDFSGFNNRVQLNFDYYVNTTNDLLFDVSIPYTTGFSSYLGNIGKIRNSGWEIDLTTHNIEGEFTWTSSLNLSHNSNKVLDMGNIDEITSTLNDAAFITRVGGPVSEFYTYKSDGILTKDFFDAEGNALVPIAKGQIEGNVRYVDENGDGVITAEDQVPTGSNLPDLTFGFTNRFSWKNFDVSVLLQGQLGGDLMFLGQRQYDYGSKTAAAVKQMSRWLNCYKDEKYIDAIPTDYINEHGIDMSWDGKTPVPDEAYGYQSRNDTRRIYDATFLRIKNLTFGYTCPQALLNNTPLKKVHAYLSIDNLATFDNYPGYNPEANGYGNSTTKMGVDYCAYPLSRRYTVGINVVF